VGTSRGSRDTWEPSDPAPLCKACPTRWFVSERALRLRPPTGGVLRGRPETSSAGSAYHLGTCPLGAHLRTDGEFTGTTDLQATQRDMKHCNRCDACTTRREERAVRASGPGMRMALARQGCPPILPTCSEALRRLGSRLTDVRSSRTEAPRWARVGCRTFRVQSGLPSRLGTVVALFLGRSPLTTVVITHEVEERRPLTLRVVAPVTRAAARLRQMTARTFVDRRSRIGRLVLELCRPRELLRRRVGRDDRRTDRSVGRRTSRPSGGDVPMRGWSVSVRRSTQVSSRCSDVRSSSSDRARHAESAARTQGGGASFRWLAWTVPRALRDGISAVRQPRSFEEHSGRRNSKSARSPTRGSGRRCFADQLPHRALPGDCPNAAP
jgi:hypothetical protein